MIPARTADRSQAGEGGIWTVTNASFSLPHGPPNRERSRVIRPTTRQQPFSSSEQRSPLGCRPHFSPPCWRPTASVCSARRRCCPVLDRFGSGMVSVICVAAITLMMLGAFPQRELAWACFLVMGAAFGFWNILSATRRQRRTPRGTTAAVSSAFRTIAWGAVPLGAALGGCRRRALGSGQGLFHRGCGGVDAGRGDGPPPPAPGGRS